MPLIGHIGQCIGGGNRHPPQMLTNSLGAQQWPKPQLHYIPFSTPLSHIPPPSQVPHITSLTGATYHLPHRCHISPPSQVPHTTSLTGLTYHLPHRCHIPPPSQVPHTTSLTGATSHCCLLYTHKQLYKGGHSLMLITAVSQSNGY